MKRIVQIVPATGWSAIYAMKNGVPVAYFEPLALWAIVEEEDGSDRHVEGLSGDECILPVEEIENFLGYLAPEGARYPWNKRAEEHYEQEEANANR